MNRYPYRTPPGWWSPKISPIWVRAWRRLRRRQQVRQQRLLEIEISGLEHVRQALDSGSGVLITPNHPGHADAYVLYEAADQCGGPWYVVTAWQVFALYTWIGQTILRHHGCFSIDREGVDRQAFKQAVDVLVQENRPLVIFAEGEVYHQNDRVTPFREGAAAVALSAAKRAKREIVCVPAALKYRYLEDPTSELVPLMSRLESEILWRPRPDLSLPERIYRLAEGLLALKEVEYLGHSVNGPLPERTAALADEILCRLEAHHAIATPKPSLPERVKALRQQVIARMEQCEPRSTARELCGEQLDDLFLVVQLYSYPGDYVREQPTIERIAETLDKFEEDVLGQYTATVRAARKATLRFGEPLVVPSARRQDAAGPLTEQLQAAVQKLLDEINSV